MPSYYRNYEGFLIAAAINKYVYVAVNNKFNAGITLKYSQIENVDDAMDIKHPIVKESLKMLDFKNEKIEISTMADIPSGTGLGSSGSFTTALLKSLLAFRRIHTTPHSLAEMACDIEINRLGEPIGKQDQYISTFGGLSCFDFHKDDSVTVQSLNINNNILFDLQDNLLLFFTGYSRSASSILDDQNKKSNQFDPEMLSNLHYVKDIGFKSKVCLENGKLAEFGKLMHDHWEYKKRRTTGMSNPFIDECYEIGIKNGALGGKVVGAGGGGFLMFYAHNKQKLRSALEHAGLEEVRFRFDFEGTKILTTT